MRLRHDLLAASQGMARGGGVGAAASEALGSFRRSGPDRLGEGVIGFGKRTCSRGAKRQERIRRTRANRARSAILWSTAAASLWR
jgi:hypothetical protein